MWVYMIAICTSIFLQVTKYYTAMIWQTAVPALFVNMELLVPN